MLGISISGKPVQAIVDMAAQITVISQAFANTFTPPLVRGEKVTMKGAGNLLKLTTVKTFRFVLGTHKKTPSPGLLL